MKSPQVSYILNGLAILVICCSTLFSGRVNSELNLPNIPLTVSVTATPLTLLTASRDHKLYYEAYNDASDLNSDGFLDIGYNPNITYYGYFDSYKCYNYSSGVFEPVYISETDKTCPTNTGEWSGDYLNYLTMSRMDALRRVLYGGYRSTDDASSTILERSFIPQDAHSWGKEYTSYSVDGYYITDYTPLSQPSSGTRHIFANTTLLGTSDPLLRVLTNTAFRVWEWLSIERPVAGTECATGNNSRSNCAGSGGTNDSTHPSDHNSFLTLLGKFANASHLQGSGSAEEINGSGNPHGPDDYYITVFNGKLKSNKTGIHEFAVDGDDAVEVVINDTVVAGWYGGHGKCNCLTHYGSIYLEAGTEYSVTFLQEEVEGQDNYYLSWKRPGTNSDGDAYTWSIVPKYSNSRGLYDLTQTTYNRNTVSSTMTDYSVRVKTCVSGLLEPECRGYPAGAPAYYKPIGILQQYGEDNSMAFGLMTGSYTKNTSGGVLRKNISSLTDEITAGTGQLSSAVGVIKALDKLKIKGFGGSHSYNEDCGVPEVNASLAEGRCRMWGNPIAEIMYEGVRYLGGQSAATTAFDIDKTGNDDATLGLPLPSWLNPYRSKADGGYPTCSKSSNIVISDISPNFDTDQLPGRYEYTAPSALTAFTSTFSGSSIPLVKDETSQSVSLSVNDLGNTIWTGEFGSGATKSFFIGQSGDTFDGAPTAKTVDSFAKMRGLAPEEPSQQGGFYEASIAYFGKINDINPVTTALPGKPEDPHNPNYQKVETYSVALASPKPRIEFPITISGVTKTITLVPFGKTVGGCGTIDRTEGKYQPTNTIVDFYILAFKNTNTGNKDTSVNGGLPYAKFRINYEDSEYGSDHDMDAIVEYELTATSSNTLQVKLTSDYAAGGCIQHMGYVISGTTKDGTYLDVRDSDTGTGSDVNYFLDTPNDSDALPLTNTRIFTPGTTTAQFVPYDPLWYAAKWGGFIDRNKNNKPDLKPEWDADDNGVPDTYFLVQNPLKLKDALRRAFDTIIERSASASNVSSNSTSIKSDTQVFQSIFNTKSWSGNVSAFPVSTAGVGSTANWQAAKEMPAHDLRNIFTKSGGVAIEFKWTNDLSTTDKTALVSENVVNFLRGDRSKELLNGGTFRDRPTVPTNNVLGDFVHSSPYFVKDSNTVFAGANDGMLHGFSATTGVELFAYIPSQALPRLQKLSQIDYGSATTPHEYFVDGEIAVTTTVQTTGHNYLVSLLGQGGKGLFGLDVTNPASFSATNVLWEYFDTSDPDLGYMLGRPVIAKMNGGAMAVLVGNGYNSTSGTAALYIFNLTTGALIKKIDTGAVGDNGLASPGVFDSDADGDIDYIYAGDLKGNVWKFDVTKSNDGLWDVAFKTGTTPEPFFTAKNATDTVQPITAQITVTVNDVTGDPHNGKRFIHFGTGSYFRTADPNDLQIQSWYGLIDENAQLTECVNKTAAVCRNVLTKRSVLEIGTLSGKPVRTVSEAVLTPNDMNDKKGWFMDLTKADGTGEGERIVTSSRVFQLVKPTLIASSIIPIVDPCVPGGKGYLNAVNPYSGARMTVGIFDLNRSGKFASYVLSGNLISSVDLGGGMPGEPVLIGNLLVVGESDGNIPDIPVPLGFVANKGRISWREIVGD